MKIANVLIASLIAGCAVPTPEPPTDQGDRTAQRALSVATRPAFAHDRDPASAPLRGRATAPAAPATEAAEARPAPWARREIR